MSLLWKNMSGCLSISGSWVECSSCWRRWLPDHHSRWSSAINVKYHRRISYWQLLFPHFSCSLNSRPMRDWSIVKWDSFYSVTDRVGRLCFLSSFGDIWSQIFIHLGEIISLLDTKSLSEIHWNQDEVLLSQCIGWEITWFSQFPGVLRNGEQLLGRARSWPQQRTQSWVIVGDPSVWSWFDCSLAPWHGGS